MRTSKGTAACCRIRIDAFLVTVHPTPSNRRTRTFTTAWMRWLTGSGSHPCFSSLKSGCGFLHRRDLGGNFISLPQISSPPLHEGRWEKGLRRRQRRRWGGRGGGDQDAEGSGQQRPKNDPRSNQHNPQHTNYWAPLTRKRHQQDHRPQRPTEHSDPTQHAKGKTGDCPGPRKETATRRNVTEGVVRVSYRGAGGGRGGGQGKGLP